MKQKIKTIIVTGPTATGKTSLGVKLARAFDGEIISVDSRQVFQGMDIGTGKDLADFGSGVDAVPYHLMDVVHPNDDFNLLTFCQGAAEAVKEIDNNLRIPIMVGGTALYLDAVLKGYDLKGGPPNYELRDKLRQMDVTEVAALLKEQYPAIYNEIEDKGNKNRMLRGFERAEGEVKITNPLSNEIEPLVLGVYFHRKDVHRRIEERLDARLEEGMIDEVQGLYDNGVSWERLDYFGLEYRYVSKFLKGELTKQEMRDQLLVKIRQFAKRQDIWFRKMEREGVKIHWIPEGELEKARSLVGTFLADQPVPEPEIQLMNVHYGTISSGPSATK